MIIRTALSSDIPQMQIVRNAVKENMLSDPALVPDKDYETYMAKRGKGWVCTVADEVVGFAFADLKDNNVWALFVKPEYEGKGIGKQLHDTMIDWYFEKTKDAIWLGTAFNTRAEAFYRMQGWKEIGTHGSKEIKFEMSYDEWRRIR